MEIPSTQFTKKCWKQFFGREMEKPNPRCFTAELCDFANYLVREALNAAQQGVQADGILERAEFVDDEVVD